MFGARLSHVQTLDGGAIKAGLSMLEVALGRATTTPFVSDRAALDASVTAWARTAVVEILRSLRPSVITAAISCCGHLALVIL